MKVGIIGAGQLAQMLAIAAKALHIESRCMGGSHADPASDVSEVVVITDHDEKAIVEFARSVDVITFENENVETALASLLAKHAPLRPSIEALALSQDRLLEKRGFEALNIPLAPFREINAKDDLLAGTISVGFPCILKTRRFGYDGKGQCRLNSIADVDKAWHTLGGQAAVLEGFVDFDCEVSIVAVRSQAGEMVFYPLTKNIHREGVLRISTAPFIAVDLQTKAQMIAEKLMTSLDYVGVLAVEFFVQEGALIVNEFAPRVHNSGHWTIEGAKTSQFENHLRAVCGLPLGSTAFTQASMMINCIGKMPAPEEVLLYPNAHLHDYHKTARAGRKLGHITVCSSEGFEAYQPLINLVDH